MKEVLEEASTNKYKASAKSPRYLPPHTTLLRNYTFSLLTITQFTTIITDNESPFHENNYVK